VKKKRESVKRNKEGRNNRRKAGRIQEEGSFADYQSAAG
jgi:hypothetical protein